MTTAWIRRIRWTGALLVPLALTGCAGLATSGPVHAQQPISNAAVPNLDVEAVSPMDGETPQAVVSGFLLAAFSLDNDYGVARQYLTPTASARWRPADGATIVTGESDFTLTPPTRGRITVSGVQQATLDGSGHVIPQEPRSRVSAAFGVTKFQGQWRVSSVPTGFRPWMTDADFQRVFSPQHIYYPSATSRVLVPDVQWYPAAGLATALARAVLATPPTWLKGVLPSPSPSRINLAINAVPVDPNTQVASIDLTASALKADATTRTALWAAMTATLTSAAAATRVEVTVDDNRLTAPHLPAQPLSAADLGYQVVDTPTSALITRKSSVLSWQGPAAVSLRGSGDVGGAAVRLPTIGSAYYDLAANASGSVVAALSTDRLALGVWVGRTLHTVPTFAGNLTRPTFTGSTVLVAGISGMPRHSAERSGAGIWAVDTGAGNRVAARPLSVPWLGRSDVLALKVSSEGARVAMIVRDVDGRTSVRVAGLLRDSRGRPTGIDTPITVAADLPSYADVAWLDDATLGVLGAARPAKGHTEGAAEVATVPLSGEPDVLAAPAGVQSVVSGGGGPDDIYVLDHRGGVWSRQGAGWVRVAGADDVAAPAA